MHYMTKCLILLKIANDNAVIQLVKETDCKAIM